MILAFDARFPALKKPETENQFLYGCIAAGVVCALITPGGSVPLLAAKVASAVCSVFLLVCALVARLVRNSRSEESGRTPPAAPQPPRSVPTPPAATTAIAAASSKPPVNDPTPVIPLKGSVTFVDNRCEILPSASITSPGGKTIPLVHWKATCSDGSMITIEQVESGFALSEKYKNCISVFETFLTTKNSPQFWFMGSPDTYIGMVEIDSYIQSQIASHVFAGKEADELILDATQIGSRGSVKPCVTAFLKAFPKALANMSTASKPIKLRIVIEESIFPQEYQSVWVNAFGPTSK